MSEIGYQCLSAYVLSCFECLGIAAYFSLVILAVVLEQINSLK